MPKQITILQVLFLIYMAKSMLLVNMEYNEIANNIQFYHLVFHIFYLNVNLESFEILFHQLKQKQLQNKQTKLLSNLIISTL